LAKQTLIYSYISLNSGCKKPKVITHIFSIIYHTVALHAGNFDN